MDKEYPKPEDVVLCHMIGDQPYEFCETTGCVYSDNTDNSCHTDMDCGNGFFRLKDRTD